jgi:hypothetical protein
MILNFEHPLASLCPHARILALLHHSWKKRLFEQSFLHLALAQSTQKRAQFVLPRQANWHSEIMDFKRELDRTKFWEFM